MKYKAVIFDLDGVICHTDAYHYLAWKQIADQLGIYFDQKINNRLLGVSRMESLEIILEGCPKAMGQEDKTRCAEEKNRVYQELLKKMTPKDLAPEVKGTLDALGSMGMKLAIGSSSRNGGFILGQIGLGDYFDAVADGNQIRKSKPDPEVFLLAAKLLGELPKDCLVVEDAQAGLLAASAGGMDSAGIGNARDSHLAKYHLRTFPDLLEVVV